MVKEAAFPRNSRSTRSSAFSRLDRFSSALIDVDRLGGAVLPRSFDRDPPAQQLFTDPDLQGYLHDHMTDVDRQMSGDLQSRWRVAVPLGTR